MDDQFFLNRAREGIPTVWEDVSPALLGGPSVPFLVVLRPAGTVKP